LLELNRHLGDKYDTVWLLHNKPLRAMTEREEGYLLRGKIQMDDSSLGGERPGGNAGRGSENKFPIVAAVSLNEAGHPIFSRITAVSGFSSKGISDWAKRHLAPGSHVLSDGLACFCAVASANCHHKDVGTGGNYPKNLPQFRWFTPCWATSRPALAVLSTPSALTSKPGAAWLLLLPLQQALCKG